MDGRVTVALLTIVAPLVLMGVTVWLFATNPLTMLVLFSVILVGCLYLLSYRTTFSETPT